MVDNQIISFAELNQFVRLI